MPEFSTVRTVIVVAHGDFGTIHERRRAQSSPRVSLGARMPRVISPPLDLGARDRADGRTARDLERSRTVFGLGTHVCKDPAALVRWLLQMHGRMASVIQVRLYPCALAVALLTSATWSGVSRAADKDVVKGLVGGTLMGAEAVLLTESALRLSHGWMYLAGGAAGAAAGAYIGYKICDDSSNKPPSFLLAGGIALIIPTIMGVLTATQYEPPASFRRDSDESAAQPKGARLEVPSVGLAQAFSRDELARFRVRQASELHVELLRGVF
jgi:MFS family permease